MAGQHDPVWDIRWASQHILLRPHTVTYVSGRYREGAIRFAPDSCGFTTESLVGPGRHLDRWNVEVVEHSGR